MSIVESLFIGTGALVWAGICFIAIGFIGIGFINVVTRAVPRQRAPRRLASGEEEGRLHLLPSDSPEVSPIQRSY